MDWRAPAKKSVIYTGQDLAVPPVDALERTQGSDPG